MTVSMLEADPKLVSILGLLLDMAGIVILFIWQVDPNARHSPRGTVVRALEGHDEGEARTYRRYRRLTYLGFSLLLVGFGLQAIGTYYQ